MPTPCARSRAWSLAAVVAAGVIEVENPTRQGFTEYPIESFVEEVPPLAGGQDIDSESDLEHADAGGPDPMWRAECQAKPGPRGRVRSA